MIKDKTKIKSYAQIQKDKISDRRERGRSRMAGRASVCAVHAKPAQTSDIIPGAGDEDVTSQLDSKVATGPAPDFDRVMQSTVRELNRGEVEQAACYVVREILPGLASLQHGANFALYWYLCAIYHVASLVRHLERGSDKKRFRAVKRALKLAKGETLYLRFLNGLAPPPAGNYTSARRAVQNRHSNYNCALQAAERQRLNARQLLARFTKDGGIEKLVEEDRASKAAQAGEADGTGSTAPFKARSERRRDVRGEQQRSWESSPGKPSRPNGASSESQSLGAPESFVPPSSDEGDWAQEAERDYEEVEATILVTKAASTLIQSGSGKRLLIAYIKPGRTTRFKVHAAQPLPNRLKQSDAETLRVLVRKIS